MPEEPNSYLAEALGEVSSVTKPLIALAAGGLIWWFSYILPVTDPSMIWKSHRDKLYDVAEETITACRRAIRNYGNSRISGPLASCFPTSKPASDTSHTSQAPSASMDRPNVSAATESLVAISISRDHLSLQNEDIKTNMELIDQSLTRAAKKPGCSELVDGWRDQYYDSCTRLHSKLTDLVRQKAQNGNLEISAIKLNNIPVRWHTWIFAMLIFAGCCYLAVKRNRVLVLLDIYIYSKVKNDSGGETIEIIFRRLPWWIVPLPTWTYGGTLSIRSAIAADASVRRAHAVLVLVLLAVLCLFTMALTAQFYLSSIHLPKIGAPLPGLLLKQVRRVTEHLEI
jgi:hypothetical protein